MICCLFPCIFSCNYHFKHLDSVNLNYPTNCFRYESNSGGEREIQRTMLELLNQLDGFDSKGDVKVILLLVYQFTSLSNYFLL